VAYVLRAVGSPLKLLAGSGEWYGSGLPSGSYVPPKSSIVVAFEHARVVVLDIEASRLDVYPHCSIVAKPRKIEEIKWQ
jgi:hypothetical protein